MQILGHRSFNKIALRDKDYKIIDSITPFIYSSSQFELFETELQELIDKHPNTKYIELIRK